MNKKTLLKKLKSLGYPLFETDESLDANETLVEVVKSKDSRLWEGFPLLLANSFERNYFSYNLIDTHFKNLNDKAHFRNLVVMALALYKYLQLKFSWADKLSKSKLFDRKLFNEFLRCFKNNKDLKNVGNLSPVRVVNTFNRYFKKGESILRDYTAMKDEFDLEYSLSQVFSKKQKELFMRKLKREKMTKTEREYYSRSVKRKVLALANPELHRLATKLSKE